MQRPRDIYDDAYFETIDISDDYMFRSVFGEDIELCSSLLSLALGHPITDAEFVDDNHELRSHRDARAAVLDVYFVARDGTHADLEMQRADERNLALRIRAHLSAMDRDAVKRGDKRFRATAETVSVFVCTFDPFGAALRRYTIRRTVQETAEPIDDRQLGVVLNATGTKGDAADGLSPFLSYVSGYHGEEVMADDLVRRVDARVRAKRADLRWRRGFVSLQESLDYRYEQGLEQGLEQGAIEGVAALVRDGAVTAEAAASSIGVPVEEVLRAVERAVSVPHRS